MYNFNLSETISLMELDLLLYPDEIEDFDKNVAILHWLQELQKLKGETENRTLTVIGDTADNLFGYSVIDNPDYEIMKRDIIEQLLIHKVSRIITTMSSGIGIVTALAALELKEKNPDIELHCLIPCKNYEIKRDKKEQELYRDILKKADMVNYLLNSDYKAGCIIKANKKAIDLSDVVLMCFKDKNQKYYKEYYDYSHTKNVQDVPVHIK